MGAKIETKIKNLTIIKEITMKKTLCVIYCTAAAVLPLSAENIIKNSNFDQALAGGCRIDNTVSDHAKVSHFTEEETKNKCVKFELMKILKGKDGNEKVSANMFFGGTKKSFGFPVKPDTTYKFSLDLKGTAEKIAIKVIQWSGPSMWTGRKYLKTSVKGMVKMQEEWQKISGTFKTGPEAKTAGLNLAMWWETKYGPMMLKAGDYILADNVVIEEITDTAKKKQ